MKTSVSDFEAIRPYHDSEINEALRRIIDAPAFATVAAFVFPDKAVDETRAMVKAVQSSDEFQVKFMHRAVRRVVETSSDGLTYEGFEKLDKSKAYLFIANHRDIVLDSAILQALLVELDIPRTEISFGSNLMINPFIIDFGKVNKMYKVQRGGTKIELLKNSIQLSAYLRYTIGGKNHSAWIAQRNGRTKDGNDKTEEALLKMLNLSGDKGFVKNFSALNIAPLTISYEYEPCGTFKVNELYSTLQGEYKKAQGEDFNSIITGFTQPKGRIHLCAGKCVNEELKGFNENSSTNENISRLTAMIDRQIYTDYKLWKTNHIAYDIMVKDSFSHLYTEKERAISYPLLKKKL